MKICGICVIVYLNDKCPLCESKMINLSLEDDLRKLKGEFDEYLLRTT